MERLKRRRDFVRAAKGVRCGTKAFTLQAIQKDGDGARVGFTVTKRVGNAVVRNRIKRRLRALCEQERSGFLPATDYVFVARRAALHAPSDELAGALRSALATAHGKIQRNLDTRA
ncbi:MAG: ribonuclease P protein component [Pseudomonadota bacterium]